jgi:hypothetical protein
MSVTTDPDDISTEPSAATGGGPDGQCGSPSCHEDRGGDDAHRVPLDTV